MRKRVLIVVQNLPVPLDRRVWLECRALTREGFSVSVICPAGPGDPRQRQLEGVQIRTYPPPPAATGARGYIYEFVYCLLRSAALVLAAARAEGFDVLQACNPPDGFFLIGIVVKAFGRPYVFDHHDLCPELYRARFGRDRGLPLRGVEALERATFRVADHVISTNESYRRIALTRGRRRPESVTVVRSGPDLDRLRRRPPTPALANGRDFLCCYLGVMGPQDGVDLLLDVIAVLVGDVGRDDCHFALLGFGDCFQELRAQARRAGIEEWVTFTGRADDAMICDYLSTAALGLSPDPKSVFNDLSTMNKTIEYMAFGLPVVSFDLHETRVSAAEAGAYVPAGNVAAFARTIDALLDDPARRVTMGAAGRRRVERSLAWSHQAPIYVDVYRRLLGVATEGDRVFEPITPAPAVARG